MPYDDLPVAADPDPVESADPDELRAEILRLRESLLAANGRTEVLRDRIAELETREEELDAANRRLHEDLARTPVARVVHAVRRRLARP
ncbi:MAG: hypothetical protein R8F63_04945 [Acidimicrobiales bacterium]|nr:hypothetical protein [Acidimicrobiales bacterium]